MASWSAIPTGTAEFSGSKAVIAQTPFVKGVAELVYVRKKSTLSHLASSKVEANEDQSVAWVTSSVNAAARAAFAPEDAEKE